MRILLVLVFLLSSIPAYADDKVEIKKATYEKCKLCFKNEPVARAERDKCQLLRDSDAKHTAKLLDAKEAEAKRLMEIARSAAKGHQPTSWWENGNVWTAVAVGLATGTLATLVITR